MAALKNNFLYPTLTVFLLTGCQTVPVASSTKERFLPVDLSQLPRITPAEVKALLDAGAELTIVDTRTPDDYDKEHISGAIFLADLQTRYNELAKDTRFVLY